MSKCFIFAIGGSGARILNTFTHLMATGCANDVMQNWVIEPIIVDLDDTNGNTTECIETLQLYADLHADLHTSQGQAPYFRVPFTRTVGTGKNFTLQLHANGNSSLSTAINYSALPDPKDRQLIDLLYSTPTLNMTLNRGFKGVPSIGTIVLNQFKQSAIYQSFTQQYAQGDRIFIIGSIFGGTGAAGLPILLKNIRQGGPLLQNAPIAIMPVQPYYQVATDPTGQSMIDSSTFIARTKAALHHYAAHLDEAHLTYHVGFNSTDVFSNHDGGTQQHNPPMAIELVAATGILDFLARPDQSFPALNAPNFSSSRDELVYGFTANEKGHFSLDSLTAPQRAWLAEPLVTYYYACLMSFYTWTGITINKNASVVGIKFTPNFGQTPFAKNYHKYHVRFMDWLHRMSQNSGEPGFFPFETTGDLAAGVQHWEANKRLPYLIKNLPITTKRGLIFKSLPESIKEAFNHFTGGNIQALAGNDAHMYNEIFYLVPRTFMEEYNVYI